MDNSDVHKKLGRRIKKFREQAHLSQQELGKITKLHRTHIGAVERGQQNISVDSVYKIAKSLKVKLKDLFDF